MKNIDFKQILQKVNVLNFQKGILNNVFSNDIDSFIIVDISSDLTLLNVDLKSEIRINALKSVKLEKSKRDEIVLNSLRDFIKDNNIAHKNAILKPHLDSLLIKRIQLPEVPDDELHEAIKWQIKEDVPFDLSEAVMDFSIIKKTAKDDGSKVLDIICAVAQAQVIKNQVSLLKQAGLTCLLVGILPFGYEKIVAKFLKQEDDKTLGILHLSEDICYILFYRDNKLQFYRELPLSFNKIRESLRGVLVSDKGRVELSIEEVNEVLSKIGIPQTEAIYKEKINSTQILSLLRPVLERLASEMRRSVIYYDSEFAGGVVSKILLAGKSATIPNIDKFLAKELSLDIQNLSLKDNLTVLSSIKQESLSEKYASLGLALDYRQNLNLLPYEFRTEKIEKFEKISLRWVVFVVVLLLAVSFLLTGARIGGYERRLDNTLLHLNALSEVKQIKNRVDELNSFILDSRKKEPPIGTILKKLSNIAGSGIFFSKFTLSSEPKTGKISGFVKSNNKNPDVVLTKFIRDLESSGYFKDATIDNVTKENKHGFDIAAFNISFKLN